MVAENAQIASNSYELWSYLVKTWIIFIENVRDYISYTLGLKMNQGELTYTRTGTKSSAAGTALSCARLNRFMIIADTLE